MTLNDAQQAAVNSTAALRVVIAGPGSGKTRTMVEAVKAASKTWAERLPASKARIAVMTFTNAGAHEFRNRLGDVKLQHCGTLHSYCFRLIQRFGGFLGYIPGKVAILPDEERIPRLLACRDKLGVKISQRALEERSPTHRQSPGIELVWREYEFLLKRNNLVDRRDGILKEGLALLRLSEVLEVKLEYLFVDEAQDSAVIDWQIYEAIPALNKMYVGDPDQSIFAFRGANPMGFVHLANSVFDNSITDAEGFKLELNYRSDIRICEAAGRLIAHNNERVPKQIKPTTSLMGHAIVESFEDVVQELTFVAVTCRVALESDGGVAVLYRMNHDVKQARDYLRSMGIPIQEPKYEQRPPDWERAMLLLAIINSPGNEILMERYLKLDNSAAEVDRWIVEAHAAGGSVEGRVWIKGHPKSGVRALLVMNGVTEGTMELIQQRMNLLAPDADLSDLIHDLHSNEVAAVASDDAKGVYVGTIHSAKGREFDVVFLPAFEQGIIPSGPALKLGGISISPEHAEAILANPDALEEERRLAFVAVTRARHELYISHCAHRRGPWGPVGLGRPSQFINEMEL